MKASLTVLLSDGPQFALPCSLFPTRERVRPTVNLILLLCTSSTRSLREMTFKPIYTKDPHHGDFIINGDGYIASFLTQYRGSLQSPPPSTQCQRGANGVAATNPHANHRRSCRPLIITTWCLLLIGASCHAPSLVKVLTAASVDPGFPFCLTPMSFALRVTNSP